MLPLKEYSWILVPSGSKIFPPGMSTRAGPSLPYVFIEPGGFGTLNALRDALVVDEVDTRNMNLNVSGTRVGPMVCAGIRAGE